MEYIIQMDIKRTMIIPCSYYIKASLVSYYSNKIFYFLFLITLLVPES